MVPGAFAEEEQRKPNIVFIMADDLGWAELGCYGQKKIETPNLDRLAAEGMRFTQAYAGAPVCAPSRCILMTGMHGGHAYIRNNHEIKDSEPGRYGGQLPIPVWKIPVSPAPVKRRPVRVFFGVLLGGSVGPDAYARSSMMWTRTSGKTTMWPLNSL
jgi:hypothetical protein